MSGVSAGGTGLPKLFQMRPAVIDAQPIIGGLIIVSLQPMGFFV